MVIAITIQIFELRVHPRLHSNEKCSAYFIETQVNSLQNCYFAYFEGLRAMFTVQDDQWSCIEFSCYESKMEAATS